MITGYIWVALIPVKSKTISLDIILSKSSIMARVYFALHSFFLSTFQLWEIKDVHETLNDTEFH